MNSHIRNLLIAIAVGILVVYYKLCGLINDRSGKVGRAVLKRMDNGSLHLPLTETKTTILIWYTEAKYLKEFQPDTERGRQRKKINEGLYTLKDCPKCLFATNKSYLPSSHAVLVDYTVESSNHFNQSGNAKIRNLNFSDLEKIQENTNSRYLIAWPRESAAKFKEDYLKRVIIENSVENIIDRSFNLTMSYRRDSDIHITNFGSREILLKSIYENRKLASETAESEGRGENELNELNDDYFMARILKDKNRSNNDDPTQPNTLWVVSNCNKTTQAAKRFDLAQKLINNGLKLKGLGECFNEKVPGTNNRWNENENLKTQYKFYLAFENGKHCKDYISEKFWTNSLVYERVPIVYGPSKSDLEAVAPEHSFIHVEDFGDGNDDEGLKKLVDYINYLDKNDTAYMEYHKWRLERPPSDSKAPYMSKMSNKWCALCDDVSDRRERNFPKSTIPSIAKWWFREMDDDECLKGELNFLDAL